MNVLSLFDGISCAKVSLERAGIPIKTYFASEIDKHAIAVSQRNHPDIVRLGDVREITTLPVPIDLLIGGSPCQDLSIAKKDRKGLDGDRSGLFWHYVRVWKALKPKWFVLENVASMAKKDRETISKELGVEPVLFDASLVSAQSRKRLFWTNIQFELPADRGIVLRDIVEPDVTETRLDETTMVMLSAPKQYDFIQIGYFGKKNHCGVGGQALRVYSDKGKSTTSGIGLYTIGGQIRKLTPVECERLQGLPDGYTSAIAKTHRYKCLANGFNVDVIAHIVSHCHSHSRIPTQREP
jgi:site-specific DNA-cytosine methylase